jgi:hypothetical protein
MKVLIVCESSGTVRESFRAMGHDAWSCDLLPADDSSPFHFQCDARDVSGEWDMMGFHPPCTFLSVSGIHWNNRGRGWDGTNAALEFVKWCMSHKCPWYLENPTSIISTRFRKPSQTIQPYEFGEDASKRTCLWLNDLPTIKKDPINRVAGRLVEWPVGSGKIVERWSNQTDSGQNKLAPSKDRWKERSKTYSGIAQAMASQWGTSLTLQTSLF